jgi:ABC-type sulfate transport system substrate-binding protein
MNDKKAYGEKERFTTTLDSEILQKIKILAIYERCSTNVLIEEAIEDLLMKYEDKKMKKEKKRKGDQNSFFNKD